MPVPSAKTYIDKQQAQIDRIIFLRRYFRVALRKLRSLPQGNLEPTWFGDGLKLTYRITVLDMKQATRYLEKFALLVSLSEIRSEDDAREGTRIFRSTYRKDPTSSTFLNLTLEVATLSRDEAPTANCRKVQVGVDTHTYTSTTPRYELICD